jgi:CxxC motif-containing protein
MRDLICIGCPIGCQLQVKLDGKEVVEVTGNTCKKGEDYAKKECTNPTRIVTSSVYVEGGEIGVVPVKTESDIPKEKIFDCIKALKGIVVKAPINIGDVIVENILDTGVNIVATRKVDEALKKINKIA